MEFETVFYFKKISSIGGVESFYWYLSQLYKNFTIIYREGDPEQIKRLAKNVEVLKYLDKYGTIKCKKFFCNYGLDIPVEAEEKYHIIHCDYKHTSFKPLLYPGFKFIGVSKLACDSFKELTGIEAELIYNPVVIKKTNTPKLTDKIYLVSATRLTAEKGGERINKLCMLLDKNNIDYEWNIYSNRRYRFFGKNIKINPPKLDLRKEMEQATYVVQLSDHESFGLTVAESLMLGTPVIITDIPAFKEIGCKHGVNSIICDLDMKHVDIDLIKKGLPEFTYKPPKSNWNKYLDQRNKNDPNDHKFNYDPNDKVKVRTLRRIWLVEEDLHIDFNKPVEVSKARASELECKGIVERCIN